jgi:hypothetical protein
VSRTHHQLALLQTGDPLDTSAESCEPAQVATSGLLRLIDFPVIPRFDQVLLCLRSNCLCRHKSVVCTISSFGCHTLGIPVQMTLLASVQKFLWGRSDQRHHLCKMLFVVEVAILDGTEQTAHFEEIPDLHNVRIWRLDRRSGTNHDSNRPLLRWRCKQNF